MTLRPYTVVDGGVDYRLVRIDGEALPVRIENDGILKIGIPKGTAKPKKWEDFHFESTPEYTACATAPRTVPKAMQRLLRYLDRIEEQCNLSITNDCARVMFKLADENSDKKLNAVEIRKGTLSALLLAELGENRKLDEKQMTAIGARAKAEGEAIASDLLSRFDKDKSGTLDYNELTTDFSAPKLPVIKEMLKKAGKLIPVFEMAAATLD